MQQKKSFMAELNTEHLCRLAQLSLDAAEQAATERDLERIIAMVEIMASIDTAGVTPLASPLDRGQRLRPDAVTEAADREHLQQNAPEVHNGYFLVPRVVE